MWTRRSRPSGTCRCRPTSIARTPRPIASGTRPCSALIAGRSRHRRPGCTSRRTCWRGCGRWAWRSSPSRCTWATARSSRCASTTSRTTSSTRSDTRCHEDAADAINRAKDGGTTRGRRGHDEHARARERGRRGRPRPRRRRDDVAVCPPGHQFRVVDALMTNFHVPRSSLLFLVCAFGGREQRARRLCARHRRGIPLLQLRRRDAHRVAAGLSGSLTGTGLRAPGVEPS